MTTDPYSSVAWPDGIDGNAGFERAWARVEARDPFVFVTGRAGTGKSTFIRALKHLTSRSMAVVAPTGVAALNAGGQTIHSFFRLRPGPINLDEIARVQRRKLFQKLDLLVIDEVSMVRADLLDAIDKFLRVNGQDRRAPFGGCQVVAVGDLYQLPPVVQGEAETRLFSEWYETEYFFSAHALAQSGTSAVEVGTVYRQSDETFLGLLNKIRDGDDLEAAVATLNARCYRRPDAPLPLERRSTDRFVTLTATNAVADAVNDKHLRALPGEAVTFEGRVEGEFDVSRNLPSPFLLSLKPGAQVMFTRNDPMHRWVNGDWGWVAEASEERILVELSERPGHPLDVERASWESVRHAYDEREGKVVSEPVGTFSQFPLMPAWAVTIHKSQGKTLSNVVIDLGRGAFAHGQAYVALSRCRRLDDIRLARPLKVSDVLFDERVREFHARLFSETLGRPAGGGPAGALF